VVIPSNAKIPKALPLLAALLCLAVQVHLLGNSFGFLLLFGEGSPEIGNLC
jgi:hypothetical protein